MYRRNRTGPRTVPWGTPETTGSESDDAPSFTYLRTERARCLAEYCNLVVVNVFLNNLSSGFADSRQDGWHDFGSFRRRLGCDRLRLEPLLERSPFKATLLRRRFEVNLCLTHAVVYSGIIAQSKAFYYD